MSNKFIILNHWANTLLVIGLCSLSLLGYLVFERYDSQNLAFAVNLPEPVNSNISPGSEPRGMVISSINLSLSVTSTEIKNNTWTSSKNSVSYLKSTVIPGELGNSVLYGHNWPNLLGNLKDARPGDKISIIYSDNSVRNFQIEYSAIVSPKDITILNNSKDHRITLYTCTGFLDTKRFVVVAKLINNVTM